MSDEFNSLAAANYWATKASIDSSKAKRAENFNTIETIANSQKIINLKNENEQLKIDYEIVSNALKELIKRVEDNTLQKENQFYKATMSKPMAEIAKLIPDFRKTYEEQQAILVSWKNAYEKQQEVLTAWMKAYEEQQERIANWMVSQKAFKELAIEYGLRLGKTKEEVVELGLTTTKEQVLNNATLHGNNASDASHIVPYIEVLKIKLAARS